MVIRRLSCPVFQLPGSNALEARENVRNVLARLKQRFPGRCRLPGFAGHHAAGHEGIREIVITLAEALLLVALVVYLFLQDVARDADSAAGGAGSLIGTFMLFPLFGFSINTLSLFGLVLAIGLVVDDAIVVVEAVQRHIEEGLTPKAAALKAMEEVSAPVIGIAIILAAVFVPTVFVPGITGRLYQQFAITIATSVIISAFNALTLSPALSAMLLRPKKEQRGPLAAFFRWFNRIFGRGQTRLCRGLPRADSQVGDRRPDACSLCGRVRLAWDEAADRLSARGGSGLLPADGPAAQRRFVAAHRRRRSQDRGYRQTDCRQSRRTRASWASVS